MYAYFFFRFQKGSTASMMDPGKPKQVYVTQPGHNKPKPAGPSRNLRKKHEVVRHIFIYMLF